MTNCNTVPKLSRLTVVCSIMMKLDNHIIRDVVDGYNRYNGQAVERKKD